MKLDILPFETWEQVNAATAASIHIESEYAVRAYQGASRAVFELVLATAQFYSHKRSIAVVPGKTPHFQAVLPYFYKEGYEVQTAPKELNVKEWVESLKKDTCLVMIPEDHAITAETQDPAGFAELEKLLNDKKIFCVILSHHKHLYHQLRPLPYTVRIHSYTAESAVAICGGKFKAPNLISQYAYWNESNFIDELSKLKDSVENVNLVQAFEANLPAGYKPFFANTVSNRVFDRALIYCEEVGGEAIQQFLAANLNRSIADAGFETHIETTHLCRWGGTNSNYSWWNDMPSENVLRGLVILSAEVLKIPNIQTALEAALKECRISEFS